MSRTRDHRGAVVGRGVLVRVRGETYVARVLDRSLRVRVTSPGAYQGKTLADGQYIWVETVED